jgi:hypothetical protein
MKSIPIGRKKFATCLDDKSQKQKEQIRGYKKDKMKIREDLEKSRDRWVKNEIEPDDEVAPI